jgi:hypothetical protein
MALKVYTCEEAARGPKTFLNIFCNFYNKMNLPQPDSGPDSNINSPYYTVVWLRFDIERKRFVQARVKSFSLSKFSNFSCHFNKRKNLLVGNIHCKKENKTIRFYFSTQQLKIQKNP